jgi:hypothetical protein
VTSSVSDYDYELYLDFRKSEGDPSRVFHAMGGMIDALSNLDRDLGKLISPYYEPQVILEDVYTGSLRAKLGEILKDLPDDALKDFELKKILGHFLLKAKYLIVKWCEAKETLEDMDDIKELESQIEEAAEFTNVKRIPAYSSINRKDLLNHIKQIQNAMSSLEEFDSIEYRSVVGNARFNGQLAISSQVISDWLTKEVHTTQGPKILKVKKPDYLGKSKWAFRYNGHAIEAKISNIPWLASFQDGNVSVNPGDSIRAELKEDIAFGYDGEVIHIWYDVLEIYQIIPGMRAIQGGFFDSKE